MRLNRALFVLLLVGAVHAASAEPRISIDRDGLSAAILAETNRQRAARGLPVLRSDPSLARAADGHTRFLTLVGSLQHDSFLPGRRTVDDRVRAEGRNPAVVSENLALIPVQPNLIRGTKSGSIEVVPGELVDTRFEPLAAMFVRAWLDSPPHRQNLLNPKFTHLGCAVQTGTGPTAVMMVYATQVFARL